MKHLVILLISIFSLTSAFANSLITNTFNGTTTVESFGTDTGASTELIQKRLKALGAEVELKCTAEVKNIIDNYFTKSYGRKRVASFLVMSSYFLPIFEQALSEAGLPDELKYLPIMESGLNGKATSPKGAAGLWQFMPATAKGYNLRVDNQIDERRDTYLSSEGACRMLKREFERFGDWLLVLAAYNAGAGTVQNAMRKAGGGKQTFWSIKQYLPKETQNYIPKFIALNYVMNYYMEHNMPEITVAQPLRTDTVHIHEKTSFSKISAAVNVSVDDLKKLNPQFKTDVISGTASKPCNLVLPASNAMAYKTSLGRPVQERYYAEQRKRPARPSKPATASRPDETKVNNKQTKGRDNWDDYAYESVPSKSMPGVYVRVPKKNRDNQNNRN